MHVPKQVYKQVCGFAKGPSFSLGMSLCHFFSLPLLYSMDLPWLSEFSFLPFLNLPSDERKRNQRKEDLFIYCRTGTPELHEVIITLSSTDKM